MHLFSWVLNDSYGVLLRAWCRVVVGLFICRVPVFSDGLFWLLLRIAFVGFVYTKCSLFGGTCAFRYGLFKCSLI